MYVTPNGGLVPPKPTAYKRKVAKGRKHHFTGQMNVGEAGDTRTIDIESNTEIQFGLVLEMRWDVVDLENQVPFAWVDERGKRMTHFFDFRANMRDGSRMAIMVKSSRALKSDRLRRELASIAQQVMPDFADRVVVVDETHLDPVETHNAELLYDYRQSESEVDALARRAIGSLAGVVPIRTLMGEIGREGQGFQAIARLIHRGDLELVRHERISHETLVRRRVN